MHDDLDLRQVVDTEMARAAGLEPATVDKTQFWRLALWPLSYARVGSVGSPAGIEPATPQVEAGRSCPLSYGAVAERGGVEPPCSRSSDVR